MALEALLEVFPEACLIYTQRPMAQAIASFCSTMDHVFSFYGMGPLAPLPPAFPLTSSP